MLTGLQNSRTFNNWPLWVRTYPLQHNTASIWMSLSFYSFMRNVCCSESHNQDAVVIVVTMINWYSTSIHPSFYNDKVGKVKTLSFKLPCSLSLVCDYICLLKYICMRLESKNSLFLYCRVHRGPSIRVPVFWSSPVGGRGLRACVILVCSGFVTVVAFLL